MNDSPSQKIDERIAELGDWRGEKLAQVRKLIHDADPEVEETWKWRGVPVWEHDGIICTGGAARFKPWDQLSDEDWTFSLANKLMGQVNVVRYGLKSVRPGGAITLTSGTASQDPSPGSAIITTVNAAVEAFVHAVAVEPSISIRVNAVSPGWVSETLQAIGRNPAEGIPAAEVAKAIVSQFLDGPTGSVVPAAKV